MSIFSKFKKDKPKEIINSYNEAVADEPDGRLPLSDPERTSEILACGD